MSCSNRENCFNYPCTFPKPSCSMRTSHCICESAVPTASDTACHNTDDEQCSCSENEKALVLPSPPIDTSKYLPPIGVFWDIENCQVPRKKSAVAIAQAIRDRFFDGYREAEFLVVCDVTKENSRVIEELNYAQINLIHVSATSKNAADEKLRQSIRRFADIHSIPAAIVLISSDINFAGDLSDLRHRKKFHVILIHNENVSEALILCANEHYRFSQVIEGANLKREMTEPLAAEIIVSNLPKEKDTNKIKNRLKQLSSNLGGRVNVISKTLFSIRFPKMEYALRAQKRMAGEDVFGSKISVSNPICIDEWNFRSSGNRNIQPKSDSPECTCFNRKGKEENNFQCNSSSLSNMEPFFQQHMPKNITPMFSNNSSKFTFPKIPNIENLRIIQNPTSSNQKLCLNNSETYAGILGNDLDQIKQPLENRKLTNFFTNQHECPVMRLNNSTSSNNESGVNSVDSNPLLQAQAQKLQLLAQNALVQRNLTHADPLAQQLTVAQINKTNGSVDSATARVIRGVHGVSINDNNCNNSSNGINNSNNTNNNAHNNDSLSKINPIEEDCESTYSADEYFEPIQKPGSSDGNSPVDLHISGLDPYMDLVMTKNFLTSMFKMHVEVLSVSVFCLTDGNVVASVKVPTLQDAQYAISQLQRRQIGSRRITIAFQNSSKCHRQLLRSQVAQLLSELPQNKTPLFRFTELFKSRFLNSISVSELKKMKDVCIISEEENGRMISANSRCQVSIMQRQEKKEAIIPYCPVHAQKTLSDSEPSNFPTVRIALSVLSKRVEKLLDSHGGKLPLASLSDCYEAQFGPLPEDSQGVPLEHLVSCVPGTEIVQSQGSFKYLTWSAATGQTHEDHAKCVSPMLVATMSVFTRELLELLKDTPRCILPFSQFIPSYHRRYGRQCRVSDYGYTKLLDLLESLPHVLQVIGNGSYKMVTLSHKAQIRRFTSDLVRILKNQTNKQLELSNFQSQYEKITGRVWDPCYYGLCELEDLLNCVPQTTVMKDVKDGQVVISIPKREQTPEEIELTKKFAVEVVELLKRVPNCSMAFNRFVPAYHNQFGRQCRVSSYGCFKLIELFEAIPDTVNIEENASRGEKYVVLTPAKRLQVLAERVCQILAAEGGSMPLIRLEFVYKFYQYDSVVSPTDYGCETFLDLLQKISQYIEIEDGRNGPVVVLKNDMDPNVIICRIRYILFENEKLSVSQFLAAYLRQYGQNIDILTVINKMPQVAKIVKKGAESYIQLTPLSVFANQMYLLLTDHRGRISLPTFESAYLNKFKKPCQPSQFGYATLSSLLSAIPETVILQNSGYYTHKRIITLNPNLKSAGFALPVLNNENNCQRMVNNGLKTQENSPQAYDLWNSDSVFSCWNVINSFIPENVTVPHPSELPIPSPKLSSPFHQRLVGDSELNHEAETTSTTTYENGGDGVADCKMEAKKDVPGKRKHRIAAQFDNSLI